MSNCFISDISRIPNNSHFRKACMYSVNRMGPRAVIHFTLIISTLLAPVNRGAKIKLPRMAKNIRKFASTTGSRTSWPLLISLHLLYLFSRQLLLLIPDVWRKAASLPWLSKTGWEHDLIFRNLHRLPSSLKLTQKRNTPTIVKPW